MPTQDELRQLLTDLIAERKKRNPEEALAQFGAELARLIAPDHKPYSKQHLQQWRAGHAPISPEAGRALVAMAAIVFDEADELAASSRPAKITAWVDIPEGTQYGGTVRYCARDGCGAPYLPTNYFQRYCPRCQQARRKARKSQ